MRGDAPGQGGAIVLNGDGVVVRHNTFKLASTGLEFMVVTGSGNKNWLIENNLINTIPSAIKNSNPVNGIIMRNNRFSIIGTGTMEYIPGGSWTGNYHDKDGTFIDNND